MISNKIPTKFAPAERAPKETLEQQVMMFRIDNILDQYLGKLPIVSLIVNKYRQVVYMNRGALDFLGIETVKSVLVQRPGEVLNCVHGTEEVGGCGTSEFCIKCGGVHAIISSQNGITMMQDCRLLLKDNTVLDVRIWASPLTINSDNFSVVTIIQHEKRRFALERIFFHDVLNTACSLQGTIDILTKYGDKINKQQYYDRAIRTMDVLIEDIRAQQQINDTENNIGYQNALLNVDVNAFGWLDVNITSPINNSRYYQNDTDLICWLFP